MTSVNLTQVEALYIAQKILISGVKLYVINPTTRAQNYISYLNQKPAKYEFSCKQSRLSEKQNTCTKNVWTMVEKYLGWQGPDREPHKIEIVIKKNKSL